MQKFTLIIKNNGIAITNQQIMWAGQQVNLTCALEPALGRLTNFNWFIPTNTVADYYVSPDEFQTNGWPMPVTNLTTATNVFYWTDEAPLAKVICTADVIAMGRTNSLSAQAKFEVRKPTADWIGAITGTIAVDENYPPVTGPALHFGTGTVTNLGITFNFTNVNFKGYSNSYVFSCAQFGKSFWRRSPNGLNWIVSDSVGSGLDNHFPVFRWPTNTPSGFTGDSPGAALQSSVIDTWRGNKVSAKLFFQPAGPSIPIAIKQVDWDWLGRALQPGEWMLETSPTNVHITASNAPTAPTPSWTNNINVHRTNFTTNSLPPFE